MKLIKNVGCMLGVSAVNTVKIPVGLIGAVMFNVEKGMISINERLIRLSENEDMIAGWNWAMDENLEKMENLKEFFLRKKIEL